MADKTKIEWTEATWNPITGCTLVSDGCTNCYAAQLAATRLKGHWSRKGLARVNRDGVAKFTGEVRFNEQWLDQPLRWRRPRRIFVCAHGDLFHESVPDEWIDKVFAVMAIAQHHTFQVLTKRPGRARCYLANSPWDRINDEAGQLAHFDDIPQLISTRLPNVWLGASVEDQVTYNERANHLINTPAAVRFLSAEPLLGDIELHSAWISKIHWIIVGGESGKSARPMHPDWVKSLRDQCNAANVPFFFKQWGEWVSVSEVEGPGDHCRFADGATVRRTGKKIAGRGLDGRTWDEMPLCHADRQLEVANR